MRAEKNRCAKGRAVGESAVSDLASVPGSETLAGGGVCKDGLWTIGNRPFRISILNYTLRGLTECDSDNPQTK